MLVDWPKRRRDRTSESSRARQQINGLNVTRGFCMESLRGRPDQTRPMSRARSAASARDDTLSLRYNSFT